ncbi:MAG TPA: helix-turn-helix domain-containing protein [Candidatus Nanoarchaeia archaeon]|nr:helix-turn-helix domain-containing protein [Candidatus Nanoarchaeia archaeon]
MIVNEELMSKLRRYFNLNLYEVRIWTALLSRGVSTAGELSNIGHVPRSRAYDVLESLEKKGFVVMKLGKPIKYIAVEPGEVVERVKKLIQQDADTNIQKLRDLNNTDVLKELENLHKQGIEYIDATDLSGAIRGKHNLYTQLESMVKNAEKSVTIVTTSKGFLRKVEALKPVFQKLNKKGVNVRIAAPLTKEAGNLLKDLKNVAEVRDSGKLNARFCVVDGKDLLFMLMHDDEVHPTYDVGVWVNTPFFAGALENMFDLAWKDFEPAHKKLKEQ